MKEANYKGTYKKIIDEESIRDFNFGNEDDRFVMQFDKSFTFGHYKVNERFGTVAGFRIGNKLYYGVALCSPSNNFSKAQGRETAILNLWTSDKSYLRGVVTLDEAMIDMHPTELLKIALTQRVNRIKHKPSWLRGKEISVGFIPKKKWEGKSHV